MHIYVDHISTYTIPQDNFLRVPYFLEFAYCTPLSISPLVLLFHFSRCWDNSYLFAMIVLYAYHSATTEFKFFPNATKLCSISSFSRFFRPSTTFKCLWRPFRECDTQIARRPTNWITQDIISSRGKTFSDNRKRNRHEKVWPQISYKALKNSSIVAWHTPYKIIKQF